MIIFCHEGGVNVKKIIEVRNLTKVYKKRKTKEVIEALKGIDFDVFKGEILGLLGPNGAGKTTTIKLICGLLQPDNGIVKINGISNKQYRLESLQHISAVLEGNRNLYWRFSVRENMEYFAGNRGESPKKIFKEIDNLLTMFSLKDKENELVNRLSRGMQQKLAIAVAMLADTEVLLLDEPTLGLDVETSLEVRGILKKIISEYGRTIIISSHDMDVIQDICDRTVIINQGKVIMDERIDHLMDLFEVRSYKISIGQPLTLKQIKSLKEQFPLYKYDEDGNYAYITIELEKSEHIYQLFAILQLNQTQIDSIDRKAIRFDEVFMEIIKGEHEYEMA